MDASLRPSPLTPLAARPVATPAVAVGTAPPRPGVLQRIAAGATAALAPKPQSVTAPSHMLAEGGVKSGSPALAQAATGAAAESADGPVVPDWVKDAVFYQVFPDRFFNGDVGNDPAGTQPWGTAPTNDSFSGGDINGVEEKLPYLKRLGVNAVYFNPVFTSPSNHKYDTVDYKHVDPHFGGDSALKSFVSHAHDDGMHVMLDMVFNHTSNEHPWFQDIREKGEKSQYFGRYDVNHWPIRYSRDDKGVLRSPDYQSWWGYATLPELQTQKPEVRDYFLDNKDSVVKHSVNDFGVDGLRFDVADEVEHDYWQDARTQIKGNNPNTYMVGETWHDASDYLKGNEFDGAMNYQYFKFPATSFFAKKEINADQFVQQLKNPYSKSAQFGMFNSLDSHDTPRFITDAGGDWYRQRPAAIFQMTYVGAPVVYYGDEIGMQGGLDPDSRRTFEWDKVDQQPHQTSATGDARTGAAGGGLTGLDAAAGVDPSKQLFGLYQKLIATRNAEPALRRGDFDVLATHNDEKLVAYRRAVAGDARDALVVLNNDTVEHGWTVPVGGFAADGTTYTDALTGKHYAVSGGQVALPEVDGNFGAVLLRDVAAGTKPS